jgi:hypothetical protein
MLLLQKSYLPHTSEAFFNILAKKSKEKSLKYAQLACKNSILVMRLAQRLGLDQRLCLLKPKKVYAHYDYDLRILDAIGCR